MKKTQLTYEIITLKDTSLTKNNVYLIVDLETKLTAIIDPACDMKQIIDVIEKEKLKLIMILLTHSHIDHIRRVNELVNLYHCEVFMSINEAMFYFFYSPSLHTFEDNEFIQLGETKLQCIVTPGHTVGSTCFLLQNSIFTGDTIFIEGCGICTGNGGSAENMYQSIKRIKEQVNDDVLVYPGHTYASLPGIPISHLKSNNVYFLFTKEQFLAFRMRPNQKNIFKFK